MNPSCIITGHHHQHLPPARHLLNNS
jgi:hypothetical protein